MPATMAALAFAGSILLIGGYIAVSATLQEKTSGMGKWTRLGLIPVAILMAAIWIDVLIGKAFQLPIY
ncbi:hypothetical protein Pan216_37770 [Planctomycetes bacterium Pan216]|uniref:Uncharacterized protein n=1 Tax=Kolteria novifilia TaxID=2527975 RepID=A0A518B7F5_9BACT|nr:hypothetical protein Pan216_37770 [Planctomycetes bacterium Pan216]